MTVNELRDVLALEVLAGKDGLNGIVDGCYIGDLLSWVMGRAQEDSAWITVMGNVNAVAVAKLAGLSCVILCEDAHLDEDARLQADTNQVPILKSDKTAYELAIELYKLLEE